MEIKSHGNGIIEIIDDILSLLYGNTYSTILLKKENISADFFDLSTGMAGEILQKFSNYRKRLAILGDYANIHSKALKDFIYESNATKQILFVKTKEEALKIFNNA